MKDYRLSEIKKICEEHSTDYDRFCGKCPLRNSVCKELENAPATWEIDKRDIKQTRKNVMLGTIQIDGISLDDKWGVILSGKKIDEKDSVEVE